MLFPLFAMWVLPRRTPNPVLHSLSMPHPMPPSHTSHPVYSSPKLSLTHLLVLFLNSLVPFSLSSLHSFAASIFAGLSSFGLCNKLITEIKIVSGVCTGLQRSATDSYPYLSSSGGCKIDMQTVPSSYTLGWKGMGVRKRITGGRWGYSGGKVSCARKFPPRER